MSTYAAPMKSLRPSSILAVHDLHEEIVAGGGSARCTVRTLDGISCEVHLGELLVLQGGTASGANSLLDVFAGVRTRVRGTRLVNDNVRIRRDTISRAAARAIVSAWSTPAHQWRTFGAPRASPTAYLLKVRAGTPPDTAIDQWRQWATSLSPHHSAIVLAMQQPLSDASVVADHMAMPQRQSVVREGMPARDALVRVLTLKAGRIVSDSHSASM